MPSNFLKKIEPCGRKEFQKQKQNKMSCHLCFNELEFHEIAGYNPDLPPFSEDRTNFCWEDEEQTTTAPICDACYWAEGSEDEDAESADELERRFLNAIRGQDPAKFTRGIKKIVETRKAAKKLLENKQDE